MKKLLSIFVFFCSCLTVFAQEPVREIPKPSSQFAVNDLADILNPQQEQLLNDRLTSLKQTTSNEIAVATINTLNGGSLEEVANTTYRAWGIGTAKNNNGILILVVKDDRKVRIEVGYGLEGAIPDAVAGSIIRNDMQPSFRENDYYHGILRAVESLGEAAKGEYNIPTQQQGKAGVSGGSIFKFIIIAIIILVVIGRGGGGRGGRMMSRRGNDWLGPAILGSMLGGGGGSSWGSSGGGGFGGGGFGGFGGGSSGGGGASGSW